MKNIFLVVLCVKFFTKPILVCAQLDLPPIEPKSKNVASVVSSVNGKPRVVPNSYAVKIIGSDEVSDEEDKSEVIGDGRSASTDYDRDRSLRYGPPYIDENNRQFQRNNYENYYNGNRSGYDDERRYYQNRYPNNYRDDDRYYANRNRPTNNGDDDKYYAPQDRQRYGNPGGYNDDKYYADRNPQQNPYYQTEYERNRYGERPNYPQVSFDQMMCTRPVTDFRFHFAEQLQHLREWRAAKLLSAKLRRWTHSHRGGASTTHRGGKFASHFGRSGRTKLNWVLSTRWCSMEFRNECERNHAARGGELIRKVDESFADFDQTENSFVFFFWSAMTFFSCVHLIEKGTKYRSDDDISWHWHECGAATLAILAVKFINQSTSTTALKSFVFGWKCAHDFGLHPPTNLRIALES